MNRFLCIFLIVVSNFISWSLKSTDFEPKEFERVVICTYDEQLKVTEKNFACVKEGDWNLGVIGSSYPKACDEFNRKQMCAIKLQHTVEWLKWKARNKEG